MLNAKQSSAKQSKAKREGTESWIDGSDGIGWDVKGRGGTGRAGRWDGTGWDEEIEIRLSGTT